MYETLETTRLWLRRWGDSDAGFLAQLASDPRMVRYIGDGQCWPDDRAVRVASEIVEHWRAHGFGWRVAVERGAESRVGFVALNYAGPGTAGLDPGEFEVGWWFVPSHWGRGLASEGARAICEEAFTRLAAPSVVARLQPENLASAGVARRLGMTREFITTGKFGEGVAVYRLARRGFTRTS